jgi:very-short-patch-repair endonuclease
LDKGSIRSTVRARNLRNNPTPAESTLWAHLSGRQRLGIRFNRQVQLGPYFCDFVARSTRLVVEVDGGQHDWQSAEDATRTRFLESIGFRVIRFWNNDVLERTEGVVAEIDRVLADMIAEGARMNRPSPSPSRKREGKQ